MSLMIPRRAWDVGVGRGEPRYGHRHTHRVNASPRFMHIEPNTRPGGNERVGRSSIAVPFEGCCGLVEQDLGQGQYGGAIIPSAGDQLQLMRIRRNS